jgi:hypothetical protein
LDLRRRFADDAGLLSKDARVLNHPAAEVLHVWGLAMSSLSISLSHQSLPHRAAAQARVAAPAPWEWTLPSGQAARLRSAPRARWLRVVAGRVWLTRTGAGPQGGDHWLAAGDSLLLPAGSDWVAEGDPSARAQLLEAPRAGSPLSVG